MKPLLPLLLAVPVTPGVSAAPPETAGGGFDVVRYEVVLKPDLSTQALSGRETIVVKAVADIVRLVFSPNALHIDNATLDGKPVTPSSTAAGIVFDLTDPLRAGGSATLRFDYAGTPARGLHRTGSGLYTSYFACDWMVCLQDAPGDKADFALDLTLPQGMESLGVGVALPRRDLPDGLVLHRWRSVRPYSPYLFGFAAGPFGKFTAAPETGAFAYLDGTGSSHDIATAFQQTPLIAAFFADKAGVPLPDRRYAQLLVDGDAAQEAASFSIIGAAQLQRDLDDPESGWIIAHELAHQWWGNLVTCASWQDFWLNEGIATFMVAAWKEHAYGVASYREEMDRARNRLQTAREQGFDMPLAWRGKYPSLGVRRSVQYSKGALFLDHLRTQLGDAVFWRGIKTYTRKHAGGTVSSRDFQVAMQHASGRDLQPLFAQWVYGDVGKQ